MAEHDVVFVTNDKWVLQGGKLDDTDEGIMKQAAQGGKAVVVMSIKQALEAMEKQEPEKFVSFKERMKQMDGGIAGKPLTVDEIVVLAAEADERKSNYTIAFSMWMKKEQAKQVKDWRVNERYSWRAVSRATHRKVKCGAWPGWKEWEPPSNQIAGMSLCLVAAKMLDENYLDEPWN